MATQTGTSEAEMYAGDHFQMNHHRQGCPVLPGSETPTAPSRCCHEQSGMSKLFPAEAHALMTRATPRLAVEASHRLANRNEMCAGSVSGPKLGKRGWPNYFADRFRSAIATWGEQPFRCRARTSFSPVPRDSGTTGRQTPDIACVGRRSTRAGRRCVFLLFDTAGPTNGGGEGRVARNARAY